MIVVVFGGTHRDDIDLEEYGRTSARMQEIVATIPGFISYNTYESDRADDIGVVRFDSLEALEAWRTHPDHLEAQEKDRSSFSENYWIQVASTVREYEWTNTSGYHSDLRKTFAQDSQIKPMVESPQTESDT